MPFSGSIAIKVDSMDSERLGFGSSTLQATPPSPEAEKLGVAVTAGKTTPTIPHPEPPTPPPSEDLDDEFPRRRYTIGSVRELGLSSKKLADTGIVALKPALKSVRARIAQNNALAQRKQTTFSPTLTLISETEDYSNPIVRTASLGATGYQDEGAVNLQEVAKIVRRRLSVIREQSSDTPSVVPASNSNTIENTELTGRTLADDCSQLANSNAPFHRPGRPV